MSKVTGRVLDVANYRGSVSPGVATLVDDSRYGNDGAMTNVTWTRLPNGLWAMVFNGTTSLVTVPSSTVFDFTSVFTLETWFRKDDTLTSAFAFSRRDGVSKGFDMGTHVDDNFLFRAYDSVGNKQIYQAFPAAAPFVAGNWYHIVGASNGTSLVAWINAIAMTPTAHSGTLVPHTGANLLVGRYGSLWLNGRLTLMRIYSYSLSAGEILQHYETERSLFGV